MKIAIVDDNKNDADNLSQLLDGYALKKKVDFLIKYYESGEDFLHASDRSPFDVLFLDIFMGGIDGIEVARELRRKNDPCLVIFLTTSTEHIWQAASLHGFDYILKDQLSQERLTCLMDDVRKKIHFNDQIINFDSGIKNVNIPARSVQSIIADGNYTRFILSNNAEERYRVQFSKIAGLIESGCNFVLCNRGVAVNMDFIIKEFHDEFEIKKGTRYPIRKKDRAKIINKYHEYQFQKLEEM